jgi:type II secretory pathway pseudopilin PulG
LIELLVVIAIIGILSSVVLASLNTARAKGADAAIKGDLAGVRSTAEVNYDTLGQKYSTTGVAIQGTDCGDGVVRANTIFADTNILAALAHAKATNGGTILFCNINAAGSAYAIATTLKTANTFWCIDSMGASKGTQGNTANQYTGMQGAATAALTDNNDMTCN